MTLTGIALGFGLTVCEIFHFPSIVELSFILCRIIEENNGKTPLTYNSMQAIVKKLGPPRRPLSAPCRDNLKGTLKHA